MLVEQIPDPCPLCTRPNYFPSDHHLVPKSRGGKVTKTICSDCHRMIHAGAGWSGPERTASEGAVADEVVAEWERRFVVPSRHHGGRHETSYFRAMHAIQHYLRTIENVSGCTFSISEDPHSPDCILISGRKVGWNPRDAVFACVERDIQAMLNNLIVPPAPPKSVWTWLRENPYK